MAYKLSVDQPPPQFRVAYVDQHGNPAQVDGPVTWASSNDALFTVVADAADPMMCTVTQVGSLGAAQLTVEADADLGEGKRSLITMLDIEIIAGEAVAGTISPL